MIALSIEINTFARRHNEVLEQSQSLRDDILQALAVMEERQGNKEAAIALLERALKQDPLDAPLLAGESHQRQYQLPDEA